MQNGIQTPKQALNPAFLKQKPNRAEIEVFKKEFASLLERINLKETEEFHKNLMKDFLNAVYYKNQHYINTKGRADLVIHNGTTSDSPVGVLIEMKSPINKAEMVTKENLNVKSFQELVLYYLRERKTSKNLELRYLIITNIYEWFVFDARNFEDVFGDNTKLEKQFTEFENKTSAAKTTDTFYKEIAAPAIENVLDKIQYTHFDIREYEETLRNANTEDDKQLIAMYKFLSPIHLLKLPFANDANELNHEFYAELLHIMGLEEVKRGAQKFIERKKEGSRDSGSLLENAIERIEIKGKSQNVDAEPFDIALNLTITWINRILFLKLLEAQIVKYNSPPEGGLRGTDFAFLSPEKLHDYNDLDMLFFSVLAKTETERKPALQAKFSHVPYLNSSLFEMTEIEDKTICIDSLDNNIFIDLHPKSVLHGRGNAGVAPTMRPLEYLLRFLDAYDFSSEGSEEIQEENKPLISASVLGLIFEKINGYKDGSFFTPSFITMYMCREAIPKAVIQKFNDAKGWNCQTISDLYNKIDTIAEANRIFNSIRICDPAVGSGHFLVSALNELIRIKSELGILVDKTGKRLRDYHITIENDELIVTDSESGIFQYHPQNLESQRVQETLFFEKQTLIENCLFGVDINPNSVQICRLRLWIELLKHAYYKQPPKSPSGGRGALETFPNIDINIKHGNSLMSRFNLHDKFTGTSGMEHTVKRETQKYKNAVLLYKSTTDKATKQEYVRQINEIRTIFLQLNDAKNDKDYAELKQAENELFLQTHGSFAEFQDETWQQRTAELTQKAATLDKIYKDKVRASFEWRFEFPEVLNDDGDFVGFDLVIGNPPYLKEGRAEKSVFDGLRDSIYYQGKMDLWYLFVCFGMSLLKENGILSFIATNNWVTNEGASKMRNYIIENTKILQLVDFGSFMVFDSASIQTMVMSFLNQKCDKYSFDYRKLAGVSKYSDVLDLLDKKPNTKATYLHPTVVCENYRDKFLTFNADDSIFEKIAKDAVYLEDKEIAQGIVPNPDVVNNKNIWKISQTNLQKFNIKVGDGVFVVGKDKFTNCLDDEIKYIKPLYEPSEIEKFHIKPSKSNILYITKNNFLNDAPNILKHLVKYKDIMEDRRENQNEKLDFYHLHWSRDSSFFEQGEKILSVRKCTKPTFAYTKEECYVMMAVNIIKTKKCNLKYLLGLLNSSLIAFWLKNKGKMQGDNYQLDKEPLMQIPIKIAEKQEPIIALVDKILAAKSANPAADTLEWEKEIDALVYELYGVTNLF
ncbi:Eco57I restriction endonuclease [Candidatus Symbiothrix dinenymphae]|nr:Eco57I restriction endonuclease [Candidatus Symbiothrix dinenymphae]